MKQGIITFICVISSLIGSAKGHTQDTIPPSLLGYFEDDYKIRYHLTDSVWKQEGGMDYHILTWNTKDKFIIARNGAGNGKSANQYTRIDYMSFSGMEPWTWGYCLTVFDAPTEKAALDSPAANRDNPRKGCNGYPFSRMKKSEPWD